MILKDHGIVLKLLFVQYIININQRNKQTKNPWNWIHIT